MSCPPAAEMDLDAAGRTVLVTGGSSGIGRETVRALGGAGARVLLTGRDRSKGAAVVDAVADAGGDAELLVADFASLTAVERLAAQVRARCDRLDALVNNAGTYAPEARCTANGVEATFAVNHLAPFLLTTRLFPLLRAASGRVVTVSAELHRRAAAESRDDFGRVRRPGPGYDGRAAYARSKLANVLFTLEFARRARGSGVTATCYNPGFVPGSGLFRDSTRRGGVVFAALRALPFADTQTPERAARTGVYLAASADAAGVTGEYFEDCEPSNPAAAAADDERRRRLWNLSAELTRLSPDETVGGRAGSVSQRT